MNPGEEKRFDGLLKNKFNEFEAAPNAAVWQAVSQTLPPAKSGLMQRALPFGLGTAFGIMVSLGFVSGYQHFAGNTPGGNPTASAELTSANRAETTPAPALATTPAAAGSAISGHSGSGATQNSGSGTESALARANTSISGNSVSDAASNTTYSRRRVVTTEYQHNRYTTSETVNYQEAAQRRTQPVAEASPLTATTPAGTATTAKTQAPAPVNTIAMKPATAAPSAWLTGHELDTAIAKVLTVDPKLTGNKAELKELLKAQGTVLAVLQNRNDSLLLALKDAELDSTLAKVRINRPRRHSSIKPPVGWQAPSKWAISASYEATPQWGALVINPAEAKATENVRSSRNLSVGIKHRVNQRLSFTGGVGVTQVQAELNYNRKEISEQNDTLNGTPVVVTHIIDQHQYLRPTYQFINVPIAVQYRIGGYGHLGVGINAGLQSNFYRGGTMAVLSEGQYMLQKASATQGPFRSFSMAATGGIDLSYRVTPRITMQAGPTLRYWAISPYKQADAGYKFLPGLQFGMSWDL